MPVIAIADLYGLGGRRAELAALFRDTEAQARGTPGCRRYVFAVRGDVPDEYVLVSEWETQEAMEAYHRSDAFARYQFEVADLLARPSEMTVYTVTHVVKPIAGGPLDPRRAD